MLKGYDRFVQKVSYLSGKKGLLIPLYAILVLAVSLFILILSDRLPEILAHSALPVVVLAFAPALGVVVVEVVGFTLVYQLWRLRDSLRSTYAEKSYSRIVPVGFAGVLLVISLSFNQLIPFFAFARPFWSHASVGVLGTPLDTLSGTGIYLLPVKGALAAVVFALGVMMAVRSLLTFGFDYMTVVYLYFPEESTMQDHRIYSVLRHPTYAAAIMLNLAGAIFTLTPISLFLFVLYVLGFWVHVRFVEEKELLERFGESYTTYRRGVPAFVVNPKHLKEFFGFLMGRV